MDFTCVEKRNLALVLLPEVFSLVKIPGRRIALLDIRSLRVRHAAVNDLSRGWRLQIECTANKGKSMIAGMSF